MRVIYYSRLASLTLTESINASFRFPHPGGGLALRVGPRMDTPDAHEPGRAIESVQLSGREFTAAMVEKHWQCKNSTATICEAAAGGKVLEGQHACPLWQWCLRRLALAAIG